MRWWLFSFISTCMIRVLHAFWTFKQMPRHLSLIWGCILIVELKTFRFPPFWPDDLGLPRFIKGENRLYFGFSVSLLHKEFCEFIFIIATSKRLPRSWFRFFLSSFSEILFLFGWGFRGAVPFQRFVVSSSVTQVLTGIPFPLCFICLLLFHIFWAFLRGQR